MVQIETKQKEDFWTVPFQPHMSIVHFYPFLLQKRVKMSYYHIFCGLLAEQNCQHIWVLDFLVQWLQLSQGRKVFVSSSCLGFFAQKRSYSLFSTPIQKHPGCGSVLRSNGSIPHVSKNNQINVHNNTACTGNILFWNCSSEFMQRKLLSAISTVRNFIFILASRTCLAAEPSNTFSYMAIKMV